jgi:DNA polymerase elongation subunit (family B)
MNQNISTICTPEIYSQILEMLKKQQLNYHQFYNVEIETDEYSFIKFMQSYKNNEFSKVLNKSYYDIEIYGVDENGDIIDEFPEPEKANYIVNAVAIYNNVKNEAKIFCITDDCNIKDQMTLQQEVLKYYDNLIQENSTYAIPDIKIEIVVCENEKNLFISIHQYLRSLNTLMLIGFNSMIFDDPYMMNRGIKLFGEERYFDMVSEFQVTKYSSRIFEWPDYILVDLLKLYQPVDAGGMGLGSSLPSYKLDAIAEKELGLTKLDLDDHFVKVYRTNIVQYLTYNLLDTLLVYKLDAKLQFLELIFSLAKYNNSTMGAAINGRSIMYLYRNDLIYTRQNKVIRNRKFSREVFYPIETEKKK